MIPGRCISPKTRRSQSPTYPNMSGLSISGLLDSNLDASAVVAYPVEMQALLHENEQLRIWVRKGTEAMNRSCKDQEALKAEVEVLKSERDSLAGKRARVVEDRDKAVAEAAVLSQQKKYLEDATLSNAKQLWRLKRLASSFRKLLLSKGPTVDVILNLDDLLKKANSQDTSDIELASRPPNELARDGMLAVHETMTDLFLTIRQTMFAAASRESRLKTQLEQQGISPASNEPPTGHTPDQPGSLVQRDRSDDGREGGSSNNDNDTSNSNADNAPPPPLPAHSAGSSKPTSMRDFDSLDDGEGATSLPHPKPAADSCRPNTIKVRETPAHQLWETAAARYDDVNPPSGRGSKALAPAAVFAEKLGDRPPPGSGGAEAWLKASLEADNAALLDKSDQLALENTQLREALLHSRDRAVAGMAAGRPPQSAPAQPGAASLPQQRADAPYHSVPPLPQHLLPSPPRPVQTQGGGYASELSNHSQASHTAPAVENRSSQPLSDAIPSLPQPQGSGHAFMFPSVGVPSPFHHSPLYNVGPPAPQVSPAGAHLVQPFTSAPSVGLPSLPMTPTGIGRGIDTAQDRLRSVNSNLGKLTDLLHKSARHDAGPVDHRQV